MPKFDIGFNSQRDNENFNGKFPGYVQCFSTSVWMLMSYYSLQIDALNDKQLAKYVDDVEASVGSIPALAEELKKKDPSVTGKTSLLWMVQKAGLQLWLDNLKVKGKAVCELSADFSKIKTLLKDRPVVIGTSKMGGLPGGHIVLGIGYDDIHTVCHDPYGDARTKYKEQRGASVYYEDKFLEKYFSGRILYWEKVI